MSKTVDQRVVEMQFDNRHFERNVSTTMTTLEKLKKSLHIPDSSQSLNNIGQAAKKVNLSGLTSAVETVHAKFSALEVMGVTALANITNSAVNAGKRIIRAFTIDPVKTGFQEYELKMGSIQTIMAGTGESLERVNQKLDELNKYSDDTIYSFQDMTSNIGKFTNAGVGLDDAVDAIKGISNVAAISGANTNEASRAMYNFSQALSAGYVQLIDWKSIELANMGTAEFRQQLIDAAVAVGTLTKSSDGFYKTIEGNEVTVETFRNTLSDKWLTSDALIRALKNYADGTTEIGERATAAATEVKTFTMMMDTLKESVQSGWARTWEILVGDFEEAKSVFTTMSKYFGAIIDTVSNARNELLENALSSPWDKLIKKVNEAGIETDDFITKIRKNAKRHNKAISSMTDEELTLNKMMEEGVITKDLVIETLSEYAESSENMSAATEDLSAKLAYFQDVVDRVWRGEFKNAPERYQLLAEAGYDYAEVQALVNKTVDGHRLTLEDLSEEQLASVGYTQEQIEAIRQLKIQAEQTNTPLNELLDNISKPSGRELLLESFKNILEAITKPLTAIKEAWDKTFPASNEDIIYKIIEKFHALTESLIISDEAAENLKKVFEGLFAGFQVGNLLISKTIMSAIKIAAAVLELFGTDLVEVAGIIADYIIQLRDWIKEHTIFVDSFNKIAKIIKVVIEGVRACVKAFLGLDVIQNLIDKFTTAVLSLFGDMSKGFSSLNIDTFCAKIASAFESAAKWIESLNDSQNLGRDLIDGLVNGLKEGVKKVVNTVIDLATSIIEAFCGVTKIASPSKVFFALGGFLVAGLIGGLQNGFPAVWEVLSAFGSKCIEFVKSIDIGQVIAAGFAVGILVTVKKIVDVAKMMAKPAEGLGEMLSGVGNFFNGLRNKISPKEAPKWVTLSKALLTVAGAIAILIAGIYILGKMDPDELLRGGGAIIVLTGLMVGLMAAMKKIGGNNFKASFAPLLVIAGSLILMCLAMKKLASIDLKDIPAALSAMAIIVGGLVILLGAFRLLVNGKFAKHIDEVGWMMVKLSAAFLLMAFAIKIVSKIDPDAMSNGLLCVAGLTILFGAMVALSLLAGKNADKAGKMLWRMAVAMLIMVSVIKIASMMKPETIGKGLLVMGLIGALFGAFIVVSLLAGKNADKAGKMLLRMSIALGIAVLVIKIAGELDMEKAVRGIAVIAALEILFAAFIAASHLAGDNAGKAAKMLLAMSAAMLVVTAVIFVISKIPSGDLWKAIGAISVISILFMGIIAITKLAQNCKGTLLMVAVALGILSATLIALSFIGKEQLQAATMALGAIMTVFAGVIAATKFAGQVKVGSILAMTLIIAAIGAVLFGMSALGVDNALENAAAISLVMISMVAVLAVISLLGNKCATAIPGIVMLSLLVIPMALFIKALSNMKNVENAEGTVKTLITLMAAMTLLMVPLTIMGNFIPGMLMGIAGLLLMVVPMMAFIGALRKMEGLDVAEGTVKTLITLMTAMTLLLIPLTIIGSFALAAIGGIAALVILIAAIGGLAVGVGYLMEENEKFEQFLDKGMPVLIKIMKGIGEMIGEFVGGMVEGVAKSLPVMGKALSDFTTNATPFFETVDKSIDEGLLNKIKILSEALFILSAAELLGAIADSFSSESTLSRFGAELSDFMEEAQTFFDGLSSVDAAAIQSVKNLAEAISILTTADILDALIIGDPIAQFAQQLPLIGEGFNAFISEIGEFNPDVVKAACDSIKLLADAAALIPNNGGILGAIMGENDIGSFGEMFGSVGKGLRDFINNIGTFSDTEIATVGSACTAITKFAEAGKSIENTGGWVGAIIGENDIDDFANRLPAVAAGLRAFLDGTGELAGIGTFGKTELDTVDYATQAIVKFAKAGDSIGNTGGWLGKIIGENDIDDFADMLPAVGEGLHDFVDEIDEFGEPQYNIAKWGAKAIIALGDASREIPSGSWLDKLTGSNDMEAFAENLETLGEGIDDFVDEIDNIDRGDIDSAIDILQGIVSLANVDVEGLTDQLEDLCDSLETAAENAVKAMTDAFDSYTSKQSVKNAIKSLIEDAADYASTDTIVDKFKYVGRDLVKGFAKGLKEYSYLAEDAAEKMANAAIDAAEDVLDINSPSRVFRSIGGSAGEGFVQGILGYASRTYDAGSTMADTARMGLANAIGSIADVIQSDMDMQPTIRPVLDLSDVRSGAASIGSMLGNSGSVGVAANVGAISSMMALRGQNGTNADVVGAIDKLSKSLGNLGNTTYNVNGVTYDDGSNISDAVRTLVRAAKIERRV